MRIKTLGAVCLALALSAACGGGSNAQVRAATTTGVDSSRCVQESQPGVGFPVIPAGHHAQATPRAALDDYLTVQPPTAPHLASNGWQETPAKFGHHAFVHVSGARADHVITVVPAAGDGWWVGEIGAC